MREVSEISKTGTEEMSFTNYDEIQDLKLLAKIKRIVARGNDVEIKRKKDGSFAVYEIKKTIA